MQFNFPQLKTSMFHYTSEQGILGIFQKDKIVLQLTKADCLNDYSEGREIFSYLDQVCNDLLLENVLNTEQYYSILALKNNFSTTLPVGFYLKDVPYTNSEDRKNEKADRLEISYKECDVYLMSFCENSDFLPMWNYYASYGKQGYSIHFDSNNLSILHEGKECYASIEKVIYKDSEKYARIKEEIKSAVEHDNYLLRIQDGISLCQYLFKNEAFEYEQEIRYIVAIPKEPKKETFDIKFKAKNGSIMPYVELEFNNDWKWIVKGVTIGPFADVEMMRKNLHFYLEHQNHIASVNITTTNIPVRF